MFRKSPCFLLVLWFASTLPGLAQSSFRLVPSTPAGEGAGLPVDTSPPERIVLPPPGTAAKPTPQSKATATSRPPRSPARSEKPVAAPTPNADEAAAIALATESIPYNPNEAIIRPGMQISVTVYVQGKVEVSIPDQRINEAGKIALPLLRDIEVAPNSLSGAERHLTEAYGDYFKNPHVVIAFVGNEKDPMMSPWGFVTVMGRVSRQGRIAIPPTRNLTVSATIQLSGGTAASANQSAIVVYRPQSDGRPQRIPVDLQNMARRGDQAEDIPLLSGDVVFVPERIF